ncbi:MAG: sulfatase [Planctomycetales bacterium]|nr:sulfatase [Planctomycetales bacterium]
MVHVEAGPATGQQPPNVVIIYADDLGYGDLACFGHQRFRTPALDRMAREGIRFTQFYSSSPYCAPSRASLLTGRYPFRCGMPDNPTPDSSPQANRRHLPIEEITLANLLHDAGYATAMFGKWHLGHQAEFYPTRRGFDEYLGILYSNDMRPVELIRQEERIEYPVIQATLTERYTAGALDFIARQRSRPFFLYLAHAMPHKPLAASERFYQTSGAGLYGDAVAELDWSVGELLAALRAAQLDRNTLVIFTSDNGPWYGGSTGGLRGMKSQWWEGGLRVPMIAWWPGVIGANDQCDEPTIIMDVFSTVLSACGVSPPAGRVIDGRDLMPLLRGESPSAADVETDRQPLHEGLLGVHAGQVRTVRDGRWKLHLEGTPPPDHRGDDWVDPRAPDGVTILAPYEQARPADFPGIKTGDRSDGVALFDLEHDESEQHDVAAEHPDVVTRLQVLAERIRRGDGS